MLCVNPLSDSAICVGPVHPRHRPPVLLHEIPVAHPPHVAPAGPHVVLLSLARGTQAWTVVQQPLHDVASQTQAPALQRCPLEQALPHPPQLALSVWVLVHAVPHAVLPAVVQETVHVPPLQVDVAPVTVVEHFVPHVPQLALSVFVSVQAVPQTVLPLAVQDTAHEPPLQLDVAPMTVVEHLVPHVPQLAPSVFVLVHVVPQLVLVLTVHAT